MAFYFNDVNNPQNVATPLFMVISGKPIGMYVDTIDVKNSNFDVSKLYNSIKKSFNEYLQNIGGSGLPFHYIKQAGKFFEWVDKNVGDNQQI